METNEWVRHRKKARYTLDVRARLCADGKELTVRTLDIGEGGIGVISPVEIPPGSTFQVKLEFPTPSGNFEAEARMKSRNGFRYGFGFVALDEVNLTLLRSYQRRWGIRAEQPDSARR
jgi:hypothetical protein